MEASGAEDTIDRVLASLVRELPHLDVAVEGITSRLLALSRRLSRSMDETLRDFSLDWSDYKLLSSLHRTPERRRSPGVLASEIELSSGAMTNRLDRLEQAGLIRRLPDPADRRGIQVELTDKGATTFDEASKVQAEKEAIVADVLSPREMEQLNRLLRKLMLEFERREPEKWRKG